MKYTGGGLVGAGLVGAAPWLFASDAIAQQEALAEQEPLDPLAVPKYVNQLTIPRTLAPTIVRDSSGRPVRYDYEMSQNVINAQILPDGFPSTTVWAFGGRTFVPGTNQTAFSASTPGPMFDTIRGIPSRVTWRDRIDRSHILPVDPRLMWANPNAMEAPTAPFTPFPPGYAKAQFPVPVVTHTHDLLVQTAPVAGTVVGSGPPEVQLTFSERVAAVPGKIKVIGPNGTQADRGEPVLRGGVLTIPMRSGTIRGTYLVSYRVTSADGHPIGGTFSYSVRERSAIPTLDGEGAGGDTDLLVRGLIPAAKYLGYAGLVLVVGSVFVLTALWPRRLCRRGPARLAWLGVGLVGTGSVAGLVLQAPYTTGASLSGITADGVRDVLGTSYGVMHVLRLVVLGAASLLLPAVLAGRGGTVGRALLAVLGLVGVATWPLAGHPAVSPVPLVTVLADTAHLVGMAVWLGGLVMLLGFVLRRAQEDELVAILPIWSRWAVAGVGTLLLAGTLNAVVEVQTPQALLTTTYGRLILAKVGLIAVVLGVAYWSRQTVYTGAAAQRPNRLRRLVGAELAVTAIVIAVAAVLVQATPGRTASAANAAGTAPAVPYTRMLTDKLFDLRVENTPARSGSNTIHLSAYSTAEGPKTVAEWKAIMAPASGEVESVEIPLLPLTDNQALGDIVLPRVGTWIFRFTLRLTEIDQATVTATVTVT